MTEVSKWWITDWCLLNNCSPYNTMNWNKAEFQYNKMIEKEKEVKDIIEIDGVKYKRIEEEKPRGLYLTMNSCNELEIKYKDSYVGWITSNGECYILDTPERIKVYEKWREDGMPVDTTSVKWRGGIYQITSIMGDLKRMDIFGGYVYNFNECKSYSNCEDDNIIRFKHNNRPVLF